jgi:hypothetical protein
MWRKKEIMNTYNEEMVNAMIAEAVQKALAQRTWVELDEEDYIKAYELCDFDKEAAFEFFEAKLKEKNT